MIAVSDLSLGTSVKMAEKGRHIRLALLLVILTTVLVGPVGCTARKQKRSQHDATSMWNRLAGIASAVERGDDPEVLRRLEKFTTDFKDHPDLVKAVWLVGQQYYNKGVREDRQGNEEKAKDYYQKAAALRDRIIEQFPPSGFTAPAYFTAGVTYSQELNEYRKGIAYFEHFVDNWPNYSYAWRVHSLIARYYKKLRDSGDIPPAQANPKILAAYRAVIEKSPDSRTVQYAEEELEEMDKQQGRRLSDR